MRYRLRTLLIVLALGPMVLAWAYLAGAQIPRGVLFVMALEVVVGISLYTAVGFGMFIAAVRLVELIAELLVIGKHR